MAQETHYKVSTACISGSQNMLQLHLDSKISGPETGLVKFVAQWSPQSQLKLSGITT